MPHKETTLFGRVRKEAQKRPRLAAEPCGLARNGTRDHSAAFAAFDPQVS